MSLEIPKSSSLTAAELKVYQTYDRQRQRQLLGVMLPLATLALGVGSLAFTIRVILVPSQPVSAWLTYIFLVASACLAGLGTLAVRRDRLRLAALLMLSVGLVGLVMTVVPRPFQTGLDPLVLCELLSLGSLIVLAGIVSGVRAVIGTTLLMNVLTLLLLFIAPRSSDFNALLQPQVSYLTPTVLVLEWVIAGFLIAHGVSYGKILRLLGAAYERAEQLDRIKDQFITHVNHELRTPVMTLQGYVEFLRLSQEHLSPADIAVALERTSQTTTALVTLLESILEVRRIDGKADAFTPDAVSVRSAVEAALVLVEPGEGAPSHREVQVNVPDGLEIWGEATRVQQILTNLLSNAFKYSPPDAPVEVSAQEVAGAATGLRRWYRGSQPSTSWVEIRVHDYGLGIPPEQIPLLFHRFVRLPRDLASAVPGNGLGLFLCQVFAESMGGSITVESTGVEGEGSTFIARLPQAMPDASPALVPAAAGRGIASGR